MVNLTLNYRTKSRNDIWTAGASYSDSGRPQRAQRRRPPFSLSALHSSHTSIATNPIVKNHEI
jgi:hypothetical protein